MDNELAEAVIRRWDQGLPVSETSLYKAASVLGVNPAEALLEARFYTHLDRCLLEKRAMSSSERFLFSVGAGINPYAMEKSASVSGLSADELIIEALRERDFFPDIVKIANIMMSGMDPNAQGQQPPPGADGQQAAQEMMAPPQQGAVVQQQPAARIKPSPTGPEQSPASPMGNLDELLQAQQQAFQDPGMEGNGGQPPASGMSEPPPPPPSPEDRIRQVGPNLDDETIARFAQQLVRFEEGISMQVSDPKQMVKFVKELQKVDNKRIDQGIKAMGQQLEQEQAAELGVNGDATIDGPAGNPSVMAPAEGPTNGQNPSTHQEQEAAQSPTEGNMSGPNNKMPSAKPQQKPMQSEQQAAQAAVEKVAYAAKILARLAHF